MFLQNSLLNKCSFWLMTRKEIIFFVTFLLLSHNETTDLFSLMLTFIQV